MPAQWRFISSAVMLLALAAIRDSASADEPVLFEQHVRPILKARCLLCHGEEAEPKGELDLRLARLIVRGGESGAAIVAGKHAESLLWQKIDADEMPPTDKKLSTQEKATITQWIDQGARTARPEPESLAAHGIDVTEDDKAFWSFQPIRRPDVPKVGHQDLVRTSIDAFLLAQLEAKKLSYSPEADPRTLVRRLYFDLIGLPPSPEEVDEFVSQCSAGKDAYETLVDQLLASPHYGEHWARHWLDVAGYADSDGYTDKDLVRKYAYKYRDYLIRSINADRPWDELIREQLAGDELVKPPYAELRSEDVDKLIATGFLRMGPDGTGDTTIDQNLGRNDVMAATIKIVSTSLLGLTVGCAQCHVHRYDPISQVDYYRLRAIFEPAYDWKNWRPPQGRLVSLLSSANRKLTVQIDADVKRLEKERLEKLTALGNEIAEKVIEEAPEELREKLREARATAADKRNAEQKKLLKDHPRVDASPSTVATLDKAASDAIREQFVAPLDELRARRPVEEFVHCLTETPGKVPETFVFFRGDFNQPQQAVEPGELTVLTSLATQPIAIDDAQVATTGRRLAYARQLTSGKHPLVARVLVNRVWLQHFGRGIVGTPADFGVLGERPSHPELLDWLADEFMRSDWRLKQLHRMVVTSTAYRQVSRRTDELDAADAENRLLGRMSVRRLAAEELRDSILATSGQLSRKLLGPPVPVTPDEVGQIILGVDTRDGAGRFTGKKVPLGEEEFRRSVYVQVRRTQTLSMLEAFDAPALSPNCEIRKPSTVAPQSLLLMNNELVVHQSEVFADRVIALAGSDPAKQVRWAWRIAFAKEATRGQVESAVKYVEEQRADFASGAASGAKPQASATRDESDPARRALASFCQALLMSNAFLYID